MAQETKAKIKKKTKKKVNKRLSKRAKRIRRIILWIVIIVIFIAIIVLFLMSDIFNISKITVENNNKITTEEIVQASGLKVDENRFKKSKYKIIKDIKTLPYVESVKVSKKLNGEVVINITEREPTYMIISDGKYAYINNQGYILEITDVALELPILTGYTSQNIVAGARLDVEDLKKLDTVIEIIEVAKTHNIATSISEINISNVNNFILSIPSQKKTIEFGDGSNINIKILTIIEVLKKTEGQEGTIFIKNRVYFREKVV